MKYFLDTMYSVLRLLKMPFSIYGYELSFWNVFMYVVIGSMLISVIVRCFRGE